ncbi:MAG: hypothetical protein B7Z75_07300 [Acidocella sp. 20-57-95]|nr:MAG: hypothetical protein B7Z75_07300 [Acidocella sp. 20-57-95]OYV59661.1 MAG: hypothetical protein B7Z71_07590 [Acidocella sp. 21-58-7]HQT63519.1 tripartite tricarboxylate transporter TctB family protein [Acidocella sp.]HQU03309.1 tripartite tricarboxylate transporter TctB family protein [Acidocella sp.]
MNVKETLEQKGKQLVPPVFMALLAILYMSQAGSFGDQTSAEAPTLYGSVVLVISIAVFIAALLPKRQKKLEKSLIKHEDHDFAWHISSRIFGMVALFVGFIFIAGFYIAIPTFLLLFLKFISKISFLKSAIAAAIAFSLTWFLFSYVLNLEVYTGYIGGFL